MRHWRGRVAGFVAGLLLGGWLIATPAAQSYVWGAINGIPFGPGIVFATSSYLNWGSIAGDSGYGLRELNGTIQIKNNAGSWADIPASAASAGGWTDTGTVVQLSTGTDTVYVQSAGPHSIGAAALGQIRFRLSGAFTSSGAGTTASGLLLDGTITGASGDTAGLYGQYFGASITTQASDTVDLVTQARFDEPNITVGAGGAVTESATVHIAGAATEATRNYSLFNDSSALSRFDGAVVIGQNAITSGYEFEVVGDISIDADAGTLAFGASQDNIVGRAAANSLYVSKGLHIGGTSDAGDNNLLVDGTSTLTGQAIFTAVPRFNGATQATIGANGGASALTANPVGYLEVNIGGTAYIVPYYTK